LQKKKIKMSTRMSGQHHHYLLKVLRYAPAGGAAAAKILLACSSRRKQDDPPPAAVDETNNSNNQKNVSAAAGNSSRECFCERAVCDLGEEMERAYWERRILWALFYFYECMDTLIAFNCGRLAGGAERKPKPKSSLSVSFSSSSSPFMLPSLARWMQERPFWSPSHRELRGMVLQRQTRVHSQQDWNYWKAQGRPELILLDAQQGQKQGKNNLAVRIHWCNAAGAGLVNLFARPESHTTFVPSSCASSIHGVNASNSNASKTVCTPFPLLLHLVKAVCEMLLAYEYEGTFMGQVNAGFGREECTFLLPVKTEAEATSGLEKEKEAEATSGLEEAEADEKEVEKARPRKKRRTDSSRNVKKTNKNKNGKKARIEDILAELPSVKFALRRSPHRRSVFLECYSSLLQQVDQAFRERNEHSLRPSFQHYFRPLPPYPWRYLTPNSLWPSYSRTQLDDVVGLECYTTCGRLSPPLHLVVSPCTHYLAPNTPSNFYGSAGIVHVDHAWKEIVLPGPGHNHNSGGIERYSLSHLKMAYAAALVEIFLGPYLK
jgi:transposase